MSKSCVHLALGILLLGMLAGVEGCGKNPRADDRAFQSASPEIRNGWNEARAAASTNGYVAAILKLRDLRLSGKLNPDQVKSLDTYSDSLRDAMNDAAAKGNAQAQQSADELRKVLGR